MKYFRGATASSLSVFIPFSLSTLKLVKSQHRAYLSMPTVQIRGFTAHTLVVGGRTPLGWEKKGRAGHFRKCLLHWNVPILRYYNKRINQEKTPKNQHLSAANFLGTSHRHKNKKDLVSFSFLSIVLSTALSTENLHFFKIKSEYKFHPKSIHHQLCFAVPFIFEFFILFVHIFRSFSRLHQSKSIVISSLPNAFSTGNTHRMFWTSHSKFDLQYCGRPRVSHRLGWQSWNPVESCADMTLNQTECKINIAKLLH